MLDIRLLALAAAFAGLGSASSTQAQELSLVPLGQITVRSSITAAGGHLFFAGFTSLTGEELWRIDRRTDRLVLVKNIRPEISGNAKRHSFPRSLTSFGGRLYFFASPRELLGVPGDAWVNELWASDGTPVGTQPIKEFGFTRSRGDATLTQAGDALYLLARTDAEGTELWRTSGTPNTTVLVRDIQQGPDSSAQRIVGTLADHVLFIADDGRRGAELWRSDGTSDGTRIVRDINGVPAGSSVRLIQGVGKALPIVDGAAYFSANDSRHGVELWRAIDGGRDAELVADLREGPESTSFLDAEVVGLTLYLAASSDRERTLSLFRLQGPTGTPEPVGGLPSGLPAVAFAGMHVVGDDLYVFINSFGLHLWRVDAAGNAQAVSTLAPSSPPNQRVTVNDAAVVGGEFMFSALNGLWRSDGTASGTGRVAAFDDASVVDPAVRNARRLFAEDGVLYFHANDSDGKSTLFRIDPALCEPSGLPFTANQPCLNQPDPVVAGPISGDADGGQ